MIQCKTILKINTLSITVFIQIFRFSYEVHTGTIPKKLWCNSSSSDLLLMIVDFSILFSVQLLQPLPEPVTAVLYGSWTVPMIAQHDSHQGQCQVPKNIYSYSVQKKNGIDAALMKKNYSIKREWFWNVSIQSLPLSVVSNAPVTVNTPYTEGNSKPINQYTL